MGALAKAEQDLEVAKRKLYDAKSNLQYFIDQVWASYLWLCGDENPGDYDNQSYIDPQVQVYTKPIPEKITKVTQRGIMPNEIEPHEPGYTLASKEMLKNFLPYSVGPPKTGRCPDCQEPANDMVQKLLKQVQDALRRKVIEAERYLQIKQVE